MSFGDYTVASANAPNGGAFAQYHYDSTNGFHQVGGFPWGYGDFASFFYQLTNGNWSLSVTNSVETNVYYFSVTANIDSNALPEVDITFPVNGATEVTNQPDYAWQGPTDFSNLVVYGYDLGQVLLTTQTNLPSPNVLYQGPNSFTVHYDNYSTNQVVASVPVDGMSHPISNWVSTAHFQDYVTSQFTVGFRMYRARRTLGGAISVRCDQRSGPGRRRRTLPATVMTWASGAVQEPKWC